MMPDYIYRCAEGHEQWETLSMLSGTAVICYCGLEMARKPLPVAVNWGGIRPSQGAIHPTIAGLIDGADERRESYATWKREHERSQEAYEKELNK